MNVRIPGRNSKVKPDIEFIKESIKEELEAARRDEREITTRRLIKLMCYVLHENEKFGKLRCSRTTLGIVDLINQGLEYWEGDTGDFWYAVDRALAFMGPEFYPSEDDIARGKRDESTN